MSKDYVWDMFEGFYNDTIQKGETFSHDMGEHIKKELEKMYKQREEWLKNKQEKDGEKT